MENNLLTVLSHDSGMIPYRKELNPITGSAVGTIVLQQIMYWYGKSGEFYKFLEPCKHEKYITGDSWVEEIGVSKKEFTTALKKLIERGLVSKRVTIDRLTYYSINVELTRKLLNGIYVNYQSAFTKVTKGDLVYIGTETTTENNIPPNPQGGNASVSSKKKDYSEEFERFWKYYGRVGNKAKANSKWKKLSSTQKDEIRDRLPAYVRATTTDGTYPSRKNAETYLNATNEHWMDTLPVSDNKTPNRGVSGLRLVKE